MLIEPIHEFNIDNRDFKIVYFARIYKNHNWYTGSGTTRVKALRDCIRKIDWKVIK